MSELRWHPVLEEWVITATHRQDRTFFPPPNYNPLAPSLVGGFPTEIPAENYEIVVFDNKFPSLRANAPEPSLEASELYPVRRAEGVCEVVCYAPEVDKSLADLPERKILELLYVWKDRFEVLGAKEFVEYVFIFENKGREIGVTLQHPHGQIYAYPFIPPTIIRELAASEKHWLQAGTDLYGDVLAQEREDGTRIVCETDEFTAFVPFFARYPYEVHIVPHSNHQHISDFQPSTLQSLAKILKRVMLKYDNLWNRSMPYIMLMHQAPTNGKQYPFYRFHIEFYPPYRTPEKLKFLAGSEAGVGVFINDTHAEDTAKLLREAEPT